MHGADWEQVDTMNGIKLIVLLGNPGGLYAGNRHNAGRLMAGSLRLELDWRNKFKGLYAAAALPPALPSSGWGDGASYVAEQDAVFGVAAKMPPSKAHFLMPETYMNLSGQSVIEAASFYKIRCEEILVVHDELELPLGQAAFKEGGGLGGHNGLRSIRAVLGSAGFWRLRIGIGRPGGRKDPDDDISAWVLSDFGADEEAIVRQVLDSCADALLRALVYGPDSLLPEWNRKRLYPAA
ncbi:MAG: aminoacyl-tRNA hydrolase [Spirochaetaceae bacterium]|jgi:PTH1 family peptidyl-tRNA hydrolase|nr:aminoacyl-tRNA hydrolase [Spirochaetaceae bacterium]